MACVRICLKNYGTYVNMARDCKITNYTLSLLIERNVISLLEENNGAFLTSDLIFLFVPGSCRADTHDSGVLLEYGKGYFRLERSQCSDNMEVPIQMSRGNAE